MIGERNLVRVVDKGDHVVNTSVGTLLSPLGLTVVVHWPGLSLVAALVAEQQVLAAVAVEGRVEVGGIDEFTRSALAKVVRLSP